jgi:hypothetical protein
MQFSMIGIEVIFHQQMLATVAALTLAPWDVTIMNENNTICCQAAQGAKARTVDATIAFSNNMTVVILALAPWAVQIYFNDLTSAYRNNPICCHAAQEAKASTAIVPSNVTFSSYTSVAVLALAPWDVTNTDRNNTICYHVAQGARASTATVNATIDFGNNMTVQMLALAPCAAWEQMGLFVFIIL